MLTKVGNLNLSKNFINKGKQKAVVAAKMYTTTNETMRRHILDLDMACKHIIGQPMSKTKLTDFKDWGFKIGDS